MNSKFLEYEQEDDTGLMDEIVLAIQESEATLQRAVFRGVFGAILCSALFLGAIAGVFVAVR